MIVMMMARTPSLKASSRFFSIAGCSQGDGQNSTTASDADGARSSRRAKTTWYILRILLRSRRVSDFRETKRFMTNKFFGLLTAFSALGLATLVAQEGATNAGGGTLTLSKKNTTLN